MVNNTNTLKAMQKKARERNTFNLHGEYDVKSRKAKCGLSYDGENADILLGGVIGTIALIGSLFGVAAIVKASR